jgi:Tetratricopeptide repeat
MTANQTNQKILPALTVTLTIFALLLSCCFAAAQSESVGTVLKSVAAQKENQAELLAGDELPPEFQPFFAAIQNDNWESASNDYFKMKFLINEERTYHRSWWQPVVETYGAEEQFKCGDEKYFTAYANEIIQSIPSGSIYFGGTDPARFIITAMQKSQINGDPFFTLTQNALADGTYLDYLRSTYGDKIYIPTAEDSQECFNDYYADIQVRMRNNQLQPGEDVTTDPNTGKIQVTGQVAVMQINALLVKIIFDHDPNREFYIEESFPLAWMYPYLEPHGLIFKLNHEPLAQLSDDTVQRDHDFWVKTVSPMIGDWLNNETSVKDISVFAERVFHQHDLSHFTGDPNFVQNSYSCRMFSKERSSSGGLYAWRVQHAADPAEKQRMYDEADFAFRQSWALYPDSPEVVFRYVQFLMQTNRIDDALIVARTSLSLDPDNRALSDLVRNLERSKNASAGRPQTQSELQNMEVLARANP